MYRYFDGSKVVRCDHLVFGRYLESTLPILFYMGMICLIRYKEEKKQSENLRLKTLTGGIFAAIVTYVSVCLVPLMKGVNAYVHSLMAINLCMNTRKVTQTLDVIPNIGYALCLFGVLALVVYVFICLVGEKTSEGCI